MKVLFYITNLLFIGQILARNHRLENHLMHEVDHVESERQPVEVEMHLNRRLDDNGVDSTVIPDDNGVDSTVTPDDNGVDAIATPDDNGVDATASPDDNSVDATATSDDHGVHETSTVDDNSSSATGLPDNNLINSSQKISFSSLSILALLSYMFF